MLLSQAFENGNRRKLNFQLWIVSPVSQKLEGYDFKPGLMVNKSWLIPFHQTSS